MKSGNQSAAYNAELVQKYNIVDSYSIKRINKKRPNHSLLKGYYSGEIIYSLYIRDGDYMVLVDAFKNLNSANQNAQRIIGNHPQMEKYLATLGKP
ncbi:hypothetical protein [Xenorhabdus ehlersii]|uniref:Uncharacterized protein n=1 Tax=Xenorhabdus ehlersii TaxID=290111 RepID=A0A2D0IK21_9GAMM|nr:hypothetical protein [Xenorhabdus ehlersii]PHM22128.1 hypothetical protein Xehl_03924 [Xenorhabdus ehlersii]RKE87838.1 hypothetical protein BDE27_3379 [Xenorhabdus ehlersii]RKE88722.1 hypothetical protein BDE27_3375 [Xenorhabdus ehlersii]